MAPRVADALPGQVNWIPTSSTYGQPRAIGSQNCRIRQDHPNASTLTGRLRIIEDFVEQVRIFPLSARMSSNSDPFRKNGRWPRGRFSKYTPLAGWQWPDRELLTRVGPAS